MSGQSDTLDPGGSVRCFSGDSEDYKEYRRWKLWLVNKIATLDKLPKTAPGPFTRYRQKKQFCSCKPPKDRDMCNQEDSPPISVSHKPSCV